jgi:hypothetical protein
MEAGKVVGVVEVADGWPLPDDPFPEIHDGDCEARRAWFYLTDDDRLNGPRSIKGFLCKCAIREAAWVAREADALAHYDERWRLSVDPVRVEWQSRNEAYKARKKALLAYIEAEW